MIDCKRIVERGIGRRLLMTPKTRLCGTCLFANSPSLQHRSTISGGLPKYGPRESQTTQSGLAEELDIPVPRFEDISLFDDSESTGSLSPEISITSRRRATSAVGMFSADSPSTLPHTKRPREVSMDRSQPLRAHATKRNRRFSAGLLDDEDQVADDSVFADSILSASTNFSGFGSGYPL